MELKDGQSFAIAGLLDNMSQNDGAAVPFLGELPIIGYLFKSMSKRAEQTELMVLITPRLVQPLNPDEVPPLPNGAGILHQETSAGNTGKTGDVSGRLEGSAGLVDAPARSETSAFRQAVRSVMHTQCAHVDHRSGGPS